MSRRARCAPALLVDWPDGSATYPPAPNSGRSPWPGALDPASPRRKPEYRQTVRLAGTLVREYGAVAMLNSGTAPRLFWATVIVVAAIGYVQHNVRACRGGRHDSPQFYVAARITSGQRPGPLNFPIRQRGAEGC